ncbi:ComF family protein [Streptomyces sp. NBC_01216]|uniref:ComF family protein n=1 Tax=Streptomyces sp. NBC_01216 TaxID=2903778 RepID=UPI002E1272CC|nr:ComF family protein [Streptomyces sp. NBC_01216]
MRGWWRETTGLVLPVSCAGCGGPREQVCPACEAELTGSGPRGVLPRPAPAGLPEVYAAAPYAGPVRSLLLAHKERGALALARPLGVALAGAVEAAAAPCEAFGPVPLLLVPVPSSRRAVRARGHDPTRRIALAAAGRLRRAGRAARVVPVLRHGRPVADQSQLGARGRFANLAGALELVPGGARLLAAGRVVLVDDLMTTGASLAEAARVVGAVRPPTAVRPGPPSAGRRHPPAVVHPPFTAPPCAGDAVRGRHGPPAAAVVASSLSSFE